MGRVRGNTLICGSCGSAYIRSTPSPASSRQDGKCAAKMILRLHSRLWNPCNIVAKLLQTRTRNGRKKKKKVQLLYPFLKDPVTSLSTPPSSSPGRRDPAPPRRLSWPPKFSSHTSLSPFHTRCGCCVCEYDLCCCCCCCRGISALLGGRVGGASLNRFTPAPRPSCDRAPLSTGPRTFFAISELSLHLRRSSWRFLSKESPRQEKEEGRGGRRRGLLLAIMRGLGHQTTHSHIPTKLGRKEHACRVSTMSGRPCTGKNRNRRESP